MKEDFNKLERVTRKWWFFVILLVAQFIIMPFSTKNFDFNKIGNIISITLSNSFQSKMYNYYLYFQLLAIIMFLLLFILKNKFARIFNIYVFLSYIAFSVLQNIALTENYEFSFVTINIIMFLFVAYAWLREILKPQNDYAFGNLNWKESWLIPLALIAFWAPLSNGAFDFNPKLLLYSGSSLAFCLMTPVFLTIMTLNIPKINVITYRITAIIGVIIGFYNMMNFQNPKMINVAILHLPLLIISIYSLIRSYQLKNKTDMIF